MTPKAIVDAAVEDVIIVSIKWIKEDEEVIKFNKAFNTLLTALNEARKDTERLNVLEEKRDTISWDDSGFWCAWDGNTL